MPGRLLVTGGAGFIGSGLLRHFNDVGNHDLIASVRSTTSRVVPGVSAIPTGDLNGQTDWSEAVENVDAVVHCAARVQVFSDAARDSLAEFRRINVSGTCNLALQAANAGVRRFVYISSVKVNGERTAPGQAFRESDSPNTEDAYGRSKGEAEAALRQVGDDSGMEITIVRLPLVYGPGVKGNFQGVMRLASTGLPLPFGAIQNLRSFLYLGNLVDFVRHALGHPSAANETFLISDGEDLSTGELLRRLRLSAGLRPRSVSVPSSVFYLLGKLSGRSAQVDRLCGSLRVDISKARKVLGWTPPFTVGEGLSVTMDHWLRQNLDESTGDGWLS